MSAETHTPAEQKPRRPKANRPALFPYLVALFAVAFLLLVMSYFMQQRHSDQQVIEGLQQSTSALQTTQSLLELNQDLRNQLSAAEAENETLLEQNENKAQTILAMDWLWRIEREYFRRSFSSARALMEEFESSGLKEWLPAAPLVDPDYRSPLEQYQAMYDDLF